MKFFDEGLETTKKEKKKKGNMVLDQEKVHRIYLPYIVPSHVFIFI